MKSLKLRTGFEMPVLGFGTYRVNYLTDIGVDLFTYWLKLFEKTQGESLEKALRYAIECGYRHIDCAWLYHNEDLIGRVFKSILEESNGALKREDFFFVSKVWNTHHSKPMVRECLDETLKNLQLDYIDVYLIHFPMAFKVKLYFYS